MAEVSTVAGVVTEVEITTKTTTAAGIITGGIMKVINGVQILIRIIIIRQTLIADKIKIHGNDLLQDQSTISIKQCFVYTAEDT